MITRKNSPKVKVDPFFVQVADEYRKNFEREFGFPLHRTTASKQMAEVFDKMLKVNGMPVLRRKDNGMRKRKVKTCTIFWEFEL